MSENRVSLLGQVHFKVIRARPTWRTRLQDGMGRLTRWLRNR